MVTMLTRKRPESGKKITIMPMNGTMVIFIAEFGR